MELKKTLRLADGIATVGLYGVSTTFSVLLFSSLAPQSFVGQAAFTSFAVIFEVSKVALWMQGIVKRNWAFVAIALFMTIGSLVASAVSLVGEQDQRMEEGRLKSELAAVEEEALGARLKSLEREIRLTEDRLASGTGYAVENRSRLDELRIQELRLSSDYTEARSKRLSQVVGERSFNDSKNPLEALSKVIGVEADLFRLSYTLFLSVLLELGGLAASWALAGSYSSGGQSGSNRYIYTASGVSHIAGANGKCLCGGAYSGKNSESIQGTLCNECAVKALERTNR